MSSIELIYQILNKLCHEEAVYFSTNEIEKWPDQIKDYLIDSQFIRQAEPTSAITCMGCEEQCFMDVLIRPALSTRSSFAYIECDKPENLGRIPVDASQLERWYISQETFVSWVAKLFALPAGVSFKKTDTCWYIGTYRYNTSGRPLFLEIEEDATILLAGYSVPLLDCFYFKDNQFIVHKGKLDHCINSPAGSDEKPAERRARFVKRKKQLMAEGKTNFIKIIAEEEGLSETRVKQILASKKPSSKGKKITDGIYI